MNSPIAHASASPLLTVQEVAERLSVPKSWVYAKAEDGELPSFKLGHYRRFSPEAIEVYLRRQLTSVGRAS